MLSEDKPSQETGTTDSPYVPPETHVEQRRHWRRWLPIMLGMAIAAVIALPFVMPMSRGVALKSVRIVRSKEALRAISIALQQYAHVYGQFPPACTMDGAGSPLHSWRTLLLPYVGQLELYSKIDLSRPWNDPVNASMTDRTPEIYHYVLAEFDPTKTGFVAVVGDSTVIRQGRSLSPSDKLDSPRQTLLVVEVSPQRSVHWMSPNDLAQADCVNVARNAESPHEGFLHAAMADATVHRIPLTIDSSALKALTTAAGGEMLTGNEF